MSMCQFLSIFRLPYQTKYIHKFHVNLISPSYVNFHEHLMSGQSMCQCVNFYPYLDCHTKLSIYTKFHVNLISPSYVNFHEHLMSGQSMCQCVNFYPYFDLPYQNKYIHKFHVNLISPSSSEIFMNI